MAKLMKKQCLGCLYFHKYYQKGFYKFEKLGYGLCDKTREALQDKYGTCEKWHSTRLRKAQQIAIAPAILENAANAINELKQIIFEAREEEGVE